MGPAPFRLPIRVTVKIIYDSPYDVEIIFPTFIVLVGRPRLCSEFGYMSPEIENSLICAMAGLLCGSAAGGFASSKQEYSDFIDRNKATAFSDHFEAKVRNQDGISSQHIQTPSCILSYPERRSSCSTK